MPFKPGQSGNPSGDGGGNRKRQMIAEILLPHAQAFVKKLVELSKSDDQGIALAAVKDGLNRIYGTAPQAIILSGEGPPIRLVVEEKEK